MSGGTDDSELNNLGPGGVGDQNEADFRLRLNQDIGNTLDGLNLRSRRNAVMAQIRTEGPNSTPVSQQPRLLSPTRNDRPDDTNTNVRSFSTRRRSFFPSAWASALAAALVLFLVGGLTLLLINNNSQNKASQSFNAAPALSGSNSNGSAAVPASRFAAAATTTTSAGATTSAAATTTSAATTEAATTLAAAAATTSVAPAAVGAASSVTTAAATTTSTAASPNRTVIANNADTALAQTNLPPTVVNNLPIYPGATRLNVDAPKTKAFLAGLLDPTANTLQQNLNNNKLVLLSAYKVQASNLPDWYTNALKAQNFSLTAQNPLDTNRDPNISSFAWRVFTSNYDSKQSLTYFFVTFKNGTAFNNLSGTDKLSNGDTFIVVFGSHR